MYHALVRHRARRVFERLNARDAQSILADMTPDVRHVFPGDHTLGGERHSREAVARWFNRLFRLFPSPEFEVRRVVSRGWPWSTWVVIQWVEERISPLVGEPYRQEGTHWLHIRWGKVTYIHAYLDTELVAAACRHMADQGIEEAAASPITE
jgi:ketosteroid isomerase-like protein